MKKLVVVLSLVGLLGVIVKWTRSDAPEAKLLFDHYWVDHEPRGLHEEFQALFVSGEYPVGNFAVRTVWTGRWEGFHYHLSPRDSGVLDALFPASGEQRRVKWTARRCDATGFDLCLDVEGAARGVSRYYSKSAWRVKAGDLEGAAARLFADSER